MREKAQADVETMRQKVLAEADERARRQRVIILAPVEVEGQREVLRSQEEVVQGVFQEALERLRSRQGYDCDAAPADLTVQAVVQMEGDRFRVAVHPEDRSRLSDTFLRSVVERIRQADGRHVVLEPVWDQTVPGGVVVTGSDGRQTVDNTFHERLRRMTGELRLEVAPILFGSGGGRR